MTSIDKIQESISQESEYKDSLIINSVREIKTHVPCIYSWLIWQNTLI